MKILFWVPYPTEGPSNRFRVEQYLPFLKKARIDYVLHPFWNSSAYEILYKTGHRFTKFFYFLLGTISRLIDLVRFFQFDAVFIHREAYPIGGAFFESMLRMLKKPFIFDFDDAIFLPASSRSNNFVERYKKPDRIVDIVKMSKHVIAGNHYLADFASHYSCSVSIIPTPVDTDKYHPYEKKLHDELIIGWIGSITTINFLEPMRDVFIQLSKRFSYIKFKIVGGDFLIDGLSNVVSKPWSLKEEKEDLKTFDIGIMPMPDNEWTKGKCGFKAILYMSMGIPCVCSPVGMNKEIIIDGVNGYLAYSGDDWIEKLILLISDPELRNKIGREGRETIKMKYSLSVNAPRFLEVFQQIFNAR